MKIKKNRDVDEDFYKDSKLNLNNLKSYTTKDKPLSKTINNDAKKSYQVTSKSLGEVLPNSSLASDDELSTKYYYLIKSK